jgi:hypothetical protein
VSKLGVRTIALICGLSLVACDAGVKPEPAPRPIEIAKPAPAKIGEPDLTYVPADADIVMRVNIVTLRKSKLYPTYEGAIAKVLVPGVTDCAYQPLDDLTSVMVGVTLKSERDVLVFRGIDRDKMLRCLHAPNHAMFDGDFATVKNKTTVDVLTFVDATTMLVERAKEATRPTLQVNTAQDTALIDVLHKLPPQASFAIATRPGSEEVTSKWSSIGAHLEALYGTIDVDAQLKLEAAMVMKTADEATQLTNMMKTQLKNQQITALFDRLDINAQDRTITLDVVLGEAKLAALVHMVGGMLN